MRPWWVGSLVLIMLLSRSGATSAGPCLVSGPRYQLVTDTIEWSMSIGTGQSCTRGLRFNDVAIEDVKLIALPQYGEVTLQGPSLTYTPKVGFEGQDSFAVAVSGSIKRIHGTSTIHIAVLVAGAPTIAHPPSKQSAPASGTALQPARRSVTAASCNSGDVQAAIDAVSDGGTVVIPAGTCTWKTGVTIGRQMGQNAPVFETKALTIQGAGPGITNILDDYLVNPSGQESSGPLFTITTNFGEFTRISNMTIDSSKFSNLDPAGYNRGMVVIGGFTHTWRIDHIHFIVGSGHGITVHGWTYGVADHNTFDLVGWYYGIYVYHDRWNNAPNGDGSWTDAIYPGTEKAVYVEDNIFNGYPYSIAIDGWSGGRAVVRHNRLTNAGIGTHGLDTTGRARSMRSMEIYKNTITITDPLGQGAEGLRGGTFIIHENTYVKKAAGNKPGGLFLTNFRDFDSFPPWGMCDGTSPFDLNDNVTYDTGVHTGSASSAVLASSGKNWMVNQWQGYHIINNTTGLSDLIISNTVNTITTLQLRNHSALESWNPGDSFKILRATVCMDQRGRGQGVLISGDTPPWGTGITPQAWPNQVIEPSYIWNNTLNGGQLTVDNVNPWRVKLDRDYFTSAMPGYTPYMYPHPLVSGVQTPAPNP